MASRLRERRVSRNLEHAPGVVLADEPKEETAMSDPNFRDPRLDPRPLDDDIRSQRLSELESSNAMWGWVAGAVVLALVLMFVFTRGQVSDTTASNVPSAPMTTGSAPRNMAPPVTQAPKVDPSAPSTTGQGSNQ
jgi:hypothetical protein